MKKNKAKRSNSPKPNPIIIKHKGLSGKSQKLRPLETATHLQSIINYTLPNGMQAGALLLNTSRSLDQPDYKLRFIWECQGFHDDFGEIEARSIVNSIAALSRELPLGESLRVEYQCFSDYQEHQAELVNLFETAPVNTQLLIAEEVKVMQVLDARGQRRPKKIILMGTYTPQAEERERDLLEKVIKFGMGWFQQLSGANREIRQQQIDILALKGYEQGFLVWQDLFREKLQVETTALSGEQVWQFCWQELNRFNDRELGQQPELAPQLIEFNLVTGTIGENIRNKRHPTTLLMKAPSAVPASNRDYVAVDGKYVGSMFLKSQPEAFEAANGKSLREIQLNYLWTLAARRSAHDIRMVLEISRPEDFGTRYNNQQLIRQAFYRKKDKEAKGQIDVGATIELEQAIAAEKNLIGGDPVVEFALSLFIYRDTPAEMRVAARELSSYFQSPATMMLEVDTADALWVSSLPFYGRSMLVDVRDRRDRERPLLTAAYYPLLNTVNAHHTGLEFIALKGASPVYFDPFKHMGHIALWGKTRSGKSLLAAHIIYRALARHIPVTILDQPPTRDASTFKDFVERMDGAYVDIFNDALNFFETPEIPLELDSATRADMKKQSEEFVLQILSTMVLGAKGELPGVSSNKVTSLLTTALKRFFNDNQIKLRYHQARQGGIGSLDWQVYPVLGDFIKFCSIERIDLKDPTDQDVDTLSAIQTQLQRWIDGAYGKTINSPSSVSLDRPLMAIAMRGVSSNDDAAVFGSIMYAAAMRRAISSADKDGSLLFVDEASITFDLDALSLCVGRIAANGLKAGMRLMLAAQEPASVFNSAGGNKIKDAISYHLIGRIGAESFTRYCDPEMLNLPRSMAERNAKASFAPDKATCSSQWLLKIDDRFTHTRIYLPPSLVALTANNIDERQARSGSAVDDSGILVQAGKILITQSVTL
jgi:hypothetical protein